MIQFTAYQETFTLIRNIVESIPMGITSVVYFAFAFIALISVIKLIT